MKLDHESKLVIACLWWALVLCVVMAFITHVRAVAAEDECADPTWMVQRTPVGLLCIWEGGDDEAT